MEPDQPSPPHRALSSEPSIPPRDPLQDADSSLTRKRPRLDTGDQTESTSAGSPASETPGSPSKLPIISSRSHTPRPSVADDSIGIVSPRTPSKVTLNLRLQPPSTPTISEPTHSEAMRQDGEQGNDNAPSQPPSVKDVGNNLDNGRSEAPETPSESPRVEAVPEESDVDMNEPLIEIDSSEEDPDAVMGRFPFSAKFESKEEIMEAIIAHVQNDTQPVDTAVLNDIQLWMNSIPDNKNVWVPLLLEHGCFLGQFGIVVSKLLQRRSLSEPPINTDVLAFRDFILGFLKLYLFLLAIDVQQLEADNESPSSSIRDTLCCSRGHRAVRDLFRGDLELFGVLERVYRVDIHELRYHIALEIISSPLGGLQLLSKWVSLGLMRQRAPPQTLQSVFRILSEVAQRLLRSTPSDALKVQDCAKSMYDAFQALDEELCNGGKNLPVEASRDLVMLGASLLRSLCVLDPQLNQELATRHLGELAEANDTSQHPMLVSNIWKFKLFKKYIAKGKMELRIASLLQLDRDLVSIWQEFRDFGGAESPVMQFVAAFLVDAQIIDCILGVDSHPQLVTRSGNIIGFLVMTNRYTEEQADKIWQIVSNSPDHRMVAATLQMLKHIINLMAQPHLLLHIVGQIHKLPLESFTAEAAGIVRDLCSKLFTARIDWESLPEQNNPYTLLFHLIQKASPGPSSTVLTNHIYVEACDLIKQLTRITPIAQRSKIFGACVNTIKDRTEDAGASIHAINVIARQGISEDAEVLLNELHLAQHLIPEICAFVERERSRNPTPFQENAMACRLDLLAYVVIHNPESVPDEMYVPLWDHLVGSKALNGLMRDVAWKRFCNLAQRSLTNPFVTRLCTELVPSMQPIFFTKGFYEFVYDTTDGPMRRRQVLWEVEDEVLKVPGADELWRIILTAPPDTIEEPAARILGCRFLDVYDFNDVTFEVIEATHAALFRRCLDQLLKAFSVIRNKSSADSGVGKSYSPAELHIEMLRFTRTLLFMRVFVQSIRTRPKFAPFPRHDSKVSPVDDGPLNGAPMTIQYQAHDGPVAGQKKSLTVGEDDTLRDLKERLVRVTGFADFRVIGGGVPLDLDANAMIRLKDIESKVKWLLVRRAPGSDKPKVDELSVRYSRFETEVIMHFNEIYNCMDAEDHISYAIFDFLKLFPPSATVADTVRSGLPQAAEVFPPGKACRARYACHALAAHLKDLLSKGIIDDVFLSGCIRLLESALTDEDYLDADLKGEHDIVLASLFVETLLAFLKERPSKEVSAGYFKNEARLVDRLVSILSIMSKLPQGGLHARQCYSTIIEASLHSRRVWETFVKRPDFLDLHLQLLLKTEQLSLRSGIAKSIEGLCGDLPLTTSITPQEISLHFWNVIRSLLPQTVNYPELSAELFTLADLVFVKFDERVERDRDNLHSLMSEWSEMLLNYKHEVFVGRDDIDNVVYGFSKLLHLCVRSLKSFKKPLLSTDLMRNVFQKFLFIDAANRSDQVTLPELESNTRKALYDLVLALCEDPEAHSTLMHLLAKLYSFENTDYAFEGKNEIRSSTGYVGLHNPRNICYMNSLLTQLFMNREFRRFMMSIRTSDPDRAQQLMNQTQRLFAEMQDGYAKAADPRDFAQCVRGLDNQPIDINIQMDADEFYNLLFDQWEGQMLSDDSKKQFRSFYGGRTVNQIKSKECVHVSERVESFFVVQCDVKGKANLQESLQSFVEGDVMEGDNKYKCESCGGRLVDAVKRTCLKDVPDNLIFHLKRFDFDLNTMTRCKIDDHFEFPERIDIGPYKIEHLSNPEKPSSPDVFQLVGVLIHQGTADGGHYYSFIRERPTQHPKSPIWLDFNDREVSEMQAQQIASMSFGGWYEDQYQGVAKQKAFNAYMLFYQRVDTVLSEQRQFSAAPCSGPPKVPVPDELGLEIASRNKQIIRDHCLFDERHSAFVRQMLEHQRTLSNGICSQDHATERKTLFIAMEHIRHVITQTKELPELDAFAGCLNRRIQGCRACCMIVLEYFATIPRSMEDMLTRCPYNRLRAVVRNLILDSLINVRQHDSGMYGVDVRTEIATHEDLEVSDGGALDIITTALHELVLDCVHSNLRLSEELIELLYKISCLGIYEKIALLRKGHLHLALAILSFGPDLSQKFRWAERITDRKRPVFNMLMQLVRSLLLQVDLDGKPEPNLNSRHATYNPETCKVPLTINELAELRRWDVQDKCYATIVRMCDFWTVPAWQRSLFVPGDIIALIVDSESRYIDADSVLATLKMCILDFEQQEIGPFIRASLYFCKACHDAPLVRDLFQAVVTVTKGLQHQAGEEALQFFWDCAHATQYDESRFKSFTPDELHSLLIHQSVSYGPSLLFYDDDRIRRRTVSLLQYLFCSRPHLEPYLSLQNQKSTVQNMRRLISQIFKRLKGEHDADTPRHYIEASIKLLTDLLDATAQLGTSEAEEDEELKRGDELDFVEKSRNELQIMLASWPEDDTNVFSNGEYGDASDYEESEDDIAFVPGST